MIIVALIVYSLSASLSQGRSQRRRRGGGWSGPGSPRSLLGPLAPARLALRRRIIKGIPF